MASGGTACPFRGRHSPDEGFLPIISSIHRKMILSRNSSPIGKIPAVWEFSGCPHEQKEALLRSLFSAEYRAVTGALGSNRIQRPQPLSRHRHRSGPAICLENERP